MVQTGDSAPDFKLDTQQGPVTLKDFAGSPLVLYFYPKDDTSGCTQEACDFRDAMPDFEHLGVKVVGVSPDSLASHEKFAKKHGLNFTLASDPDHKVAESYGVWVEKSMYGKKYMGIERSTFVIDGKGVVRAAFHKVKVPGHVQEVKEALANL
ncbi:MAG: thioredoxin-dependent thiol peroxidase [Fimbriimonadia bacterium]